MNDYGHPITFGLSLYPSVDLVDDNTRLAQEADEAGLDYIAIQDHAYNREFLDTWTLITYLAAETVRNHLRPRRPGPAASTADDRRQGGRLAQRAERRAIFLGVGGGASADGIAAMGGPRRTPGEMIAFTEEALGVMRRASAAGASSSRASTTPSRATMPDRYRPTRSRSGWAPTANGCSRSPDARAMAGCHR